jgi:hypothetical protein
MSEYDDSHMLSKTLERIAAQATHLKEKIDAGLEIPSWAEYKIYSAYEGVGKALGTAYPGPMEEKMAAVFSSAFNRHPALKGKQSTLPDKIQAGIIKKRLRVKTAAVQGPIHSQRNREQLLAEKERVARQLSGGLSLSDGLTPASAALMGAVLPSALALTSKDPRLLAAAPIGAAAGYFGMRKGLQDRNAEIDRQLSKQAAATAIKTDPQKWEQARAEARAKMGGKHSARAMQLATQIYKKDGGGYSGAKPTASTNSLKKWTKQDWNWTGGDKPGEGGRGVYLPEQKADRLRKTEDGKDQLAAAARKKSEATREGKQYSSHGLAANTSLRSKR